MTEVRRAIASKPINPGIVGRALYDGSLARRILLSLTAMVGLTGLFGLYRIGVGSLTRAPNVHRRRPAAQSRSFRTGSPRNVTMAERYLARQPWTANAKYQIRRSDEAYLYFEDWEPVEQDRAVRFQPFAMVWMQKGHKPGEEPITITCDSAYVKFASTFDISNPDPGRIIRGALQGNVLIHGPRGLVVRGHSFVYSDSAMHIVSDDDRVEFAYDGHRGRAWGLTVDLIRAAGDPGRQTIAAEGVKSVQLRRKVAMDLLFTGNSRPGRRPSPPVSSRKTSRGHKKPPEPIHVKVFSAGRFDFVVDTSIATFHDTVRVYRPTGPRQYDSLQCDLLTLVFEPGPAQSKTGRSPPQTATSVSTSTSAKPAAESTDETPSARKRSVRGLGSGLTFRRLLAAGDLVTLVSEGNGLTAYMTNLVYDAKTRVAALTDGESVKVHQRGSIIRSPEITLLHNDDGQIQSVWCRGAGSLERRDPRTRKLEFGAEWVKELRKYPDPKSPFDVIQLEGEAIVRQPLRRTGLAADFIKLWIDRQRRDGRTRGSNSSGRIRPRQLVALRNVAMMSPQMQAETKRLDVWFVDRPKPASATSPSDTPSAVRPAKVRRSSEPTAGPTETTPGRKPQANTEPLKIAADHIQARIFQATTDRDSDVDAVWTTGHVDVTQKRPAGEKPLHVTGRKLHLRNRGENDQVLDVYGAPAHIEDRGLHIEGGEIHLDRVRNLAWVQGAGVLRLPVKRSPDGKPLTVPRMLDVWWKEQMTFDGGIAKFFGNVRTVLDENHMHCQEMDVLMTRKLSFSRTGPQRDVEVHRVTCRDDVHFERSEYEGNKLTAIRRGNVARFVLNQLTGQTEAQGPGRIISWRRGRTNRAALAPDATSRANSPLKSNRAGWEYLRITFDGKTVGNTRQQFGTFHDNVHVVYGPVTRPLQTIDPDALPPDGGWMRSRSLRFEQHAGKGRRPGYVTLLAEGNAELEGRSFHAQADFITYDESKGLYTLRASGKRNATIWRQKHIGDDPSEVHAQQMEFVPALNQLRLDRATGLDGIQ